MGPSHPLALMSDAVAACPCNCCYEGLPPAWETTGLACQSAKRQVGGSNPCCSGLGFPEVTTGEVVPQVPSGYGAVGPSGLVPSGGPKPLVALGMRGFRLNHALASRLRSHFFFFFFFCCYEGF